MKIWLDDERPMPSNYDVHVKDSREMFTLIDSGQVTGIAFDHDMGEDRPTGYDIAKYLEEKYARGELTSWITCTVHSGNPVGAANIKMALQSAYRYWSTMQDIN